MDIYIVLLDEKFGKFDSKLRKDLDVVFCDFMIVNKEGVNPFEHLEDAVGHEHDSLSVIISTDEGDGLNDAPAAFFCLEGVID